MKQRSEEHAVPEAPEEDEQPEEEQQYGDHDERNEQPPHAADGNAYGRRFSGER
jgi:hypothetical protein